MAGSELVWPQIDDILVNHGEWAPKPCPPPEGAHTFAGDEGGADRLVFDGDTVTAGQAGQTSSHRAVYYALRPDLYLVDIPDFSQGFALQFILDLGLRRALQIAVTAPAPNVPALLIDRVAQRGSQSAVDVTCTRWHGDGAREPFTGSDLLIGKQLRYTYSSTHEYDHFYLSERYYAWFCRKGPDAGLGDFEECEYIALRDDMVLFIWREKLLPCVGITVEDHAVMQTAGKIFGADMASGATKGEIVGARIRFIADIAGDD